MFSKSCEYAIRAMIFLAQNTKDESKVSISEIAKGTNSPTPFIAKIMQELTRKKLASSIKGPNGGFYLDKKSSKRSIADIVKAIDGDTLYSNCVLGLKLCSEKTPCPVHHEYREIRKNLIHMIENNTITDFNLKINSKKYFLK